jgi:hypothetical protein
MKKSLKAIQKDFEILCKTIEESTPVEFTETSGEREQRLDKLRKDPREFAKYYFPHLASCDSAPFQIEAAKAIKKHKNLRGCFKWARGHAKSTWFGTIIPMWLKCQKTREVNMMVLTSKSENSAIRLLSDLQAELEFNQRYIHDFGKQMSKGTWADGEFRTADGCFFVAIGRGQSPRGLKNRQHRPDYVLIDDVDDDKMCQNPDRVEEFTNWTIEALMGAMDMGVGRFIIAGNLISKLSVLGNIEKDIVRMQKDPEAGTFVKYYTTQVNAIDDTGKPSWDAKYTLEQIQAQMKFWGHRKSQKEYFHNPIVSGSIFRAEWIQYKKPLPLNDYDHIVAYLDPSFKSKTTNDFKAWRVWGRKGTELHYLAGMVRQCTTKAMVKWAYDYYEKTGMSNQVHFYMEANFMQDTLLDEFTTEGNARGYQLPIKGDTRAKPDKIQRIEGIAPLWERGCVFYSEKVKDLPDTIIGIEQTLGIEHGSNRHDDAPDADEGAIFLLQRSGRAQINRPVIGQRTSSNSNW